MSKLKNRNRPTHHEDVQGLTISPAVRAAAMQRAAALKAAASQAVASQAVAPKPSALSALAQAIVPSAIKSTSAAASTAFTPTTPASTAPAGISLMPGKVATASLPTAAQQALSSAGLSSAASKASSSAQKLLAAAGKLKNHPALKSGMIAAANKHLAATKTASAGIKAAATQKLLGDSALGRHQLRRAHILGAFNVNQAFDAGAAQAAITQMIAQGSQDDASATLLSEMTDLEAYIAQLSSIGQTALASSGQAIDDAGNNLGVAWLNSGGDSTFPGKVANWDASYQKWLGAGSNTGASAALNAAMASGQLVPGAGAPNAAPGGGTPTTPAGAPALTAAMGVMDTVAKVGTTAGIMPGGVIQIDQEQMLVGNVDAANVYISQRAYNPMYAQQGYGAPSPGSAHAVGAPVMIVPASPYGTGTFDPGYGDGGGGGGGFDDSDDGGGDQESAVQAFRDQGIDPFDDSSDDGSAPMDPSDGAMSQVDADKAALEDDDGSATMASMSDSDAGMMFSQMADGGGDDDLVPQYPPAYTDDDHALLEAGALDSVAGDVDWSHSWGQLFYNPAGILMDATSSPHQSRLALSPVAVQPLLQAAGAGASPAAQARLAAAQQRLMAARAQLAAQYGSMGVPGSAAPVFTPPSAYGPSGAFASSSPSYLPQATPPPVAPDPTSDDSSTEDVMGFTAEELADLIINSYETQITDADPEWSRVPASPHAGASYLDPHYPRGGSVAGRQGGLIQPEEKIIVGHNVASHYARGLDILGAGVTNTRFSTMMQPRNPNQRAGVTQRAGFVQKTAPGGQKFTSLVLNKAKRQDHATSIKNARTAGHRAISVGQKIQTQLKKSAAAIKKVAVHGVPAPVAHTVARHILTAAQLQQASQKAIDLGNKALKNADTHEKFVKTFNAKLTSGAQAARSKLKLGSGGKAIQIKGCDDDEADAVLGATMDALTVEMIGTCVPDPNDPGWCVDGTVDPNYGGSAPGAGYSSAPPDPNNPGYLMDGTPDPNYGASGTGVAGPPDYGLGAAPTADSVAPQPGVDFVPDPFPGAQGDLVPYSSQPLDPSFSFSPQALPVGAVLYDGSVAPPFMGLGSYSTFYQDVGGAPPAGGEGSGYQWHNDGWWSFRSSDYAGPAGSGDQRLKHADQDSPTAMQQRANNSMKYNWGPMIGNPNGPMRSLRYDVGGNQWFWYYDQAPAWAQQPIKQALLNQAILDYQANVAAAAADYASQQAAAQLAAQQMQQMQQQQAVEDAQQQHQLELEANQAQADASTQQLADEAQARQQQTQDTSYAAQTAAEAAAQVQLDQSQADIDQRAAETAARLDALATQTAAAAAAGPDGAYVPDDGSQDDGSTPYDGYADAKDMLDATDETQSADDVMGSWDLGEGDSWAKGEGEILFGKAGRAQRKHSRRG